MKFVALVSDGIDSPVAAYLVGQYADSIRLVYVDGGGFADKRSIKKFIFIARQIQNLVSCPVSCQVVPHETTLLSYIQHAERRFTCVFCKRMMIRYASEIAKQLQADALVMGDSLGQVASQTLQNIRVVDEVVDLPIFRPLIGWDKEEIIKVAKEIGTYSLSILPSIGCRAVPSKPATQAKLEKILDEEAKLPVNQLVKKAVDDAQLVTI